MDVGAVLTELYGRIPELARGAVEGLDAAALVARPAPDANPIGWLVWHVARVQDHHLAEVMDQDQLWTSGDWATGFQLDPDPSNTGYGHGPRDVARVRPAGPEVLVAYLDAVSAHTEGFLAGLHAADLDRIVDRRWDPPVTLGVRLVSVADDAFQHLGQAAYVRGLTMAAAQG